MMRQRIHSHCRLKCLPFHIVRLAAAIVTAGCVLVAMLCSSVPYAHAAGASVATNVEGGTLNPDRATQIELSGSGFQSVQGGFGGIYVLFGWVSDPNGGSWRPSQGGITGENYRYVPDDESNPTGYDVFVAFPGSSTASAANGGTIAADGTWSAAITVPGARFTSYDRSGNPTDVDCTTVQCGIITIGAHGVVNANNETFTPLTFGSAQTETAAGSITADTANMEQADQQTNATNSGTASTAKPQSKNNSTNTKTQAADQEGTNMATIPTLGIAGWLIVAAIILLGISIIVLAAGIGGYYAAKALLLGVSPAALEKEIAKRERKAETIRAREQLKSLKLQRKQYQRISKQQAKTSRLQSASLPAAESSMPPTVPDTSAIAETVAMPAIGNNAPEHNADIRGFFTKHQASGEAVQA